MMARPNKQLEQIRPATRSCLLNCSRYGLEAQQYRLTQSSGSLTPNPTHHPYAPATKRWQGAVLATTAGHCSTSPSAD